MGRIFLTASNGTSGRAPPGGNPASEGFSSRTDDRFHLTGPSLVLDPRVHAYRKDIADIGLAGQIFAPHYARPLARRATGDGARVYLDPSPDAEIVAELAPGEAFAVLEYAAGWAWGYVRASHLVGYVEPERLIDPA
jgi:Bacterial dipeptidyl-peptidase Sh3 domain